MIADSPAVARPPASSPSTPSLPKPWAARWRTTVRSSYMAVAGAASWVGHHSTVLRSPYSPGTVSTLHASIVDKTGVVSQSALEAGGTVYGIVPSALTVRAAEKTASGQATPSASSATPASAEGAGQDLLDDNYDGRLKLEIVGSMHEVRHLTWIWSTLWMCRDAKLTPPAQDQNGQGVHGWLHRPSRRIRHVRRGV
jgi:hypothetical protein